MYGPNGAGKSSFCEALEYSLLGHVTDAENKRFSVQDYLKNAHTRSYCDPVLLGLDESGSIKQIANNESLYRFSFIEKNRIDDFSRISSRLPARQTEIISTLFGLDDFVSFTRNFSKDIGQHIDTKGKSSDLLTMRRQEIAGVHALLDANNKILEEVAVDKTNLANTYRDGSIYVEMLAEINGTDTDAGIIKTLDAELQRQLPKKSGLSSGALNETYGLIMKDLATYSENEKRLASAGVKVSFKQLYEAIEQLKGENPDICPACKTNIDDVVSSPYILAREELKKLQEISQLQEKQKKLKDELTLNFNKIHSSLKICIEFNPDNNPLRTHLSEVSLTREWWTQVNTSDIDNESAFDELKRQISHLEKSDADIDNEALARNAKSDELNRIRNIAERATAINVREKTTNDQIVLANKSLNDFNTQNAQLITDAENEKVLILRNETILQAYTSFVNQLNKYVDSLPGLLVADLGELVVDLYNSFNSDDDEEEKLSKVILPLLQGQHLQISYNRDPAKLHNALHVLSEGHIRCLGLAILLAKNIKENSPFLIFDDPVNAIDNDHKKSIRETLYNSKHFDKKQIILASHGEEFVKDIQNSQMSGQKIKNDVRNIGFLPRANNTHLNVKFDYPHSNYILKAREFININQKREALAHARRGLESLAQGKIWKYAFKHGVQHISLNMRQYGGAPELRNLVEKLKDAIDKPSFVGPDKDTILNSMNKILSSQGQCSEWRYLNKGTHEESDVSEFDHATVLAIIVALEDLDEVFAS